MVPTWHTPQDSGGPSGHLGSRFQDGASETQGLGRVRGCGFQGALDGAHLAPPTGAVAGWQGAAFPVLPACGESPDPQLAGLKAQPADWQECALVWAGGLHVTPCICSCPRSWPCWEPGARLTSSAWSSTTLTAATVGLHMSANMSLSTAGMPAQRSARWGGCSGLTNSKAPQQAG